MSAVITSGYAPAILQFLLINGSLKKEDSKVVHEDPENPNISWMVTADQKDFYAAVEHSKDGKIARLRREENGQLTKQEVFPSGGAAPCHLALDTTRNLLFVANYNEHNSGTISVFQLDSNGKITGEIYTENFGKGSNAVPDRQAHAHPHAVYIWKDFLYVVDLGADKIWRYQITNDGTKNTLKWSGITDTPLGWGPRHLAFHNNMAYVIFELEAKIGVYQMLPSGDLKFLRAVPTVEDKIIDGEPQYGAEIGIHPNGKWLYVSNRGRGPLLVYHIDQNDPSILTMHQVTRVPDVWPRHFTFRADGKSLWLVEQKKNRLQEWAISPENGSVTLVQDVESANSPAFVIEL